MTIDEAMPQFVAAVAAYPKLSFKGEALEEIGPVTALSNAVFKPAGTGPFPAIVVSHTCGGIAQANMRRHAKELLDAGFVVLMLDSFSSRGAPACSSDRSRVVPGAVGVADAYDALAHLRSFAFVDPKRISLVGYSWGGFVAEMASSPSLAAALKAPGRFKASVVYYASCTYGRLTTLPANADRPVLLLLAEKDSETPSTTCFPLLDEYRKQGLPVSWHVYPGIGHGWDEEGRARDGYVYDKEAAEDATVRTIRFLKSAQ